MRLWPLGLRQGGACDYLAFSLRAAATLADLSGRARVVALRDSGHYDLYSQPSRPPFAAGTQPVLRSSQVLKGQWTQPKLGLGRLEPGEEGAPTFVVGQAYEVVLSRSPRGY